MFKNMKIRTKLMMGFGLLMALLCAILAYAAMTVFNINNEYTTMLNHLYIEGAELIDIIDDISAEMNAKAADMLITLIMLAVAAIAVGVTVSVVVSSSVSKPISEVVSVLESVAVGDLNVNVQVKSKDEIGLLSQSTAKLVYAIKSIVGDLAGIEREFIRHGKISYRINTNNYENSFKEVTEGINRLVDHEFNIVGDVIKSLDQISNGDFDIQIKDLPGEMIILPDAMRKFSASLAGVNTGVSAMIEAIVFNGNMDFQIDTGSYKGGWHTIMEGLNDIVSAVEKPIKAIEIAMGEMKAGNFDIAIIDEKFKEAGLEPNPDKYKGIFKNIMIALDVSFTETASYIDELEEALAQMAQGDLRGRIEREYVGSFDLIKRSVNDINYNLHKTMSEISAAADQVLSGAHQISTGAADLATGAQEQANSVQELNIAIDTINHQTQQNAVNAAAAKEMSNKSTANAQEGNVAMKQMMEAMLQITESSDNISKIVKTIQGIALQTNLLSLNAAVEAARAGEHGRGFAVVAEEVRSLAERSRTAASKTTSLIQDSITRVKSGSAIAESTADSLNTIEASAGEVMEVINSISAASKEQAEAIGRVSEGLSQISHVTQSNSAMSEETAAASEELNSQAEVLRELVSFFKL